MVVLRLKVRDSFFKKFAAPKQKSYMCNGLKKHKNVPIKKVAARLKVLNIYLKRFPKPENTSFSSGEMIDIVIGIILDSWCKIVAEAGTESRDMGFEKLITHLEVMEETVPEQKDREGTSKSKRSHGHKNDKGRDNETSIIESTPNNKASNCNSSSSSSSKSCSICRIFGENRSMRRKPTTRRTVSLRTTSPVN